MNASLTAGAMGSLEKLKKSNKAKSMAPAGLLGFREGAMGMLPAGIPKGQPAGLPLAQTDAD